MVLAVLRSNASSTPPAGNAGTDGPLSTWNVRPFTVLMPLLAVTASWCGPGGVPVGTVTSMCVSSHAVVGSAIVPSRVTDPAPLAAPRPVPVIVNEPLPETKGLETASSWGATGSWVHSTPWGRPVDGEAMVVPTCVGARSVGMIRPGRASNSVAMVRYRGL